MTSFTKHDRGFTLLELSIVLVIVSVVIGMAMTSGVTVIESARGQQTQIKIATIKQALYTLRSTHNRLPCPASLTLLRTSTNFGVEGPNGASCWDATAGNATASFKTSDASTVEGAVPVRTLGLPDDMVFDGWGNRIRYSVDVNFTLVSAFTASGNGPDNACSAIKVLDGSGASGYRTQHALYLLLSHGSNGNGAYTRNGVTTNVANTANTDEQQNCHCNGGASYDGKYVQKDITEDSTNGNNTFDDIVDYAARWQLQTPADIAVSAPMKSSQELLAFTTWWNTVNVATINRSTDTFTAVSTVTPPHGVVGIQWSPDGTYLAVIGPNGFSVYSRGGTTLTLNASNSFAHPAYGDVFYTLSWSSDSNYVMAVDEYSSPYIYVFKNTNGVFTKLADPATLPLGNPHSGTFLQTSSQIFLGGIYASPSFISYTLASDTLTYNNPVAFSPVPSSMWGSPVSSVTKDNQYLFAYANMSGASHYSLFNYSGGNYVYATSVSPDIGGAYQGSFSRTGSYVATTHGSVADALHLYKRTGTSLSNLSNPAYMPANGAGGVSLGWSYDDQYLAVGTGGGYSSLPGVDIYKRNCDTFTHIAAPAAIEGSNYVTYGVSFTQ